MNLEQIVSLNYIDGELEEVSLKLAVLADQLDLGLTSQPKAFNRRSTIWSANGIDIRFSTSRIPVGLVTLISLNIPPITSIPTKNSPSFCREGANLWHISCMDLPYFYVNLHFFLFY